MRGFQVAVIAATVIVGGWTAARPGRAQQPATDRANRETVVFSVNNQSAVELSKALLSVHRGQEVLVVAEPTSNQLIVSGPGGAVKQLLKLAAELDRPVEQVAFEARIARATGNPERPVTLDGDSDELLAKVKQLDKEGRLKTVNQIRLTTLNNQPAFLQFGQREPTIRGTAAGFGGRGRVNTVSDVDTGTIAKVTPRVSSTGTITVKVALEKSFLDREKGVAIAEQENGQPVRANPTSTAAAQTTVQFRDGQSVVVGSFSERRRDGGSDVTLFILTARIVKPSK